jgi:arginyl-tRNA synthetase
MLELAGDFSTWYTAGASDPALRVLCEDLELRRARVALVGAVQATLAQGLGILGLGAPDVM